jgi:hypothetical protein
MIKQLRVVVGALVLLAACVDGSASDASTATTGTTVATTTSQASNAASAADFEADKKLIVAMWRNASDAWGDGVTKSDIDNGFRFLIDTNYPGSTLTVEQCEHAIFGSAPVTRYREENVIDQATIERDDGWTIFAGSLKGVVPDGRIYIMRDTITTTRNSTPRIAEAEVHAVVLNGKAFQISNCA